MADNHPNVITLFTEDELVQALALLAPDEDAQRVAHEIYAKAAEELAHFDWIDPNLTLLSLISEDCAQRVRNQFGETEEEAQAREQIRALVARSSRETRLSIDDVVFDRRLDDANAGLPADREDQERYGC